MSGFGPERRFIAVPQSGGYQGDSVAKLDRFSRVI
jgi:hypothetical protein